MSINIFLFSLVNFWFLFSFTVLSLWAEMPLKNEINQTNQMNQMSLCSSMWRGPQDYVTYEFVPTSPAVSRMSGSSNLDSFRDGW